MINLIAKPTTNGYTYTLTTYALKYLLEAECMFGPRTSDYTYAGIEFIETGPPKIWYPNFKFVVIQLSKTTAYDFKQGIFQLGHEVIHILSPNGQPTTTYLEEGLATFFSKLVTDRDTGDTSYAIDSITPTKYKNSYEFVKNLLQINSNSIIELRKVQPVIGQIIKDDFTKANLLIPDNLIEKLIRPMDY
jgi:hypothetical protein